MKRIISMLAIVSIVTVVPAILDGFCPPQRDVCVCDPMLTCQVPVEIERVIDGDTVVANVNLPWDITLRHQHVRAADYDAWETSKRRRAVKVTDNEINQGILAREDLNKLFMSSKAIYMTPKGRDNYGRLLAKWVVVKDGKVISVAKWAKERGHVREEDHD